MNNMVLNSKGRGQDYFDILPSESFQKNLLQTIDIMAIVSITMWVLCEKTQW